LGLRNCAFACVGLSETDGSGMNRSTPLRVPPCSVFNSVEHPAQGGLLHAIG
jgi:hypothetical protein